MTRTLFGLLLIATVALSGCDKKQTTKKAQNKTEKPTPLEPTAKLKQNPAPTPKQPEVKKELTIPKIQPTTLTGRWEIDKQAFKALMLAKAKKQGRLARVKKRLHMLSQFQVSLVLNDDRSASFVAKLRGRRTKSMKGVWKKSGNTLVVSEKRAKNPMKCIIAGSRLTCPLGGGITFVFKKI